MRLDQADFHIFISHKSSDAKLASDIGTTLEALDPQGRVKAWVSGDDLVVGGDWNRAIKRRLANSHLLVLLYTRPSYTWDWCLYETGLFTRFEQEDVSGVVCIYDPAGGAPAPLSNFQGVRAEPAALAKCLTQLYRNTWQVSDDWRLGALAGPDDPPDNAAILAASNRIAEQFAACLGDADGPGQRPTQGDDVYYPAHRVVLDFGEPNGHGWDRIPEDALVVEGFPNTSAYTLSLFGAGEGNNPLTWGDLVRALDGAGAGWRKELDRAFTLALDERLFPFGAASFKAWDAREDRKREYQPVLYRVVRSGADRTPVGATIMLLPVGNG